jgi:two-component system, chemotaxis family, sensor kinase CheA
MTIDMSQFTQVFFDEAEELLAEMERLLLAIDISSPEAEDLNAIFRTAHSVKGGASTFGLTNMAEVTHHLESLLDKIRKGEMTLTADHVDAFLAAKDVLKMQLDGHKHGAPVDLDAVANVRMLLQSLSQSIVQKKSVVASPESQSVMHAVESVFTDCFCIELPQITERDANALTEELGLLGQASLDFSEGNRFVITLVTNKKQDDIISICAFLLDPDDLKISQKPASNVAKDEKAKANDDPGYGFFEPMEFPTSHENTDQERGYGFFDATEATPNDDGRVSFASFGQTADQVIDKATLNSQHAVILPPEKQQTPKKDLDKSAHSTQESSSIRVSIEKVDQLINLVGELVITQAMIEQRTSSLDPMLHERLLNSVGQLVRNTRDLQESVMSIRMMPMDYVFSRFPRMVRDLASKLGKKVEFVTNGAATELDKGLIERIVDPLTHLVRNSIDHGFEMPEVRRASGKGETGRLFLSAGHQGGNIVIEVSDDGAGLNREKILAKAIQQGLPVSEGMPDGEIWQLIFAPGFSTAEIVTDVSGRGVGMDVVKRNITAMGGTVEIRSAKGFGTTIVISLPLTLAILDGMSIKVGEEVYILPLGYVVESLQPMQDDIKHISGTGYVVKVRGEYLPLIPLYQVFDIEPRFTDPSQGIVVILESDGKKAGLFVDDLVGQQQVVVKNLESNYRKVSGISGATILGDGGVSLILDVSALIRSNYQVSVESVFS